MKYGKVLIFNSNHKLKLVQVSKTFFMSVYIQIGKDEKSDIKLFFILWELGIYFLDN